MSSQSAPLLGPDALATLALIALLPVTAAPGFTHLLVFREAVALFGGLAVLILWLILLAASGTLVVRASRLLGLITAGTALIGLSALWSHTPSLAFSRFGAALALLGPVLSILAPTRRRISLRALTRALACGLLGALGLTLAHTLGYTPYAVPEPYPDTHHLLILDNALAAAIALPIAIATAFRNDGIDRILAVATALLAVALIGASHNSALFVGLAAGALVTQLLLVIARRHGSIFARSTLAWITAALLVLAADAMLPSTPEPPPIEVIQAPEMRVSGARVLERRQPLDASLIRDQIPAIPKAWGARSYLFESAVGGFSERPILGVGAGQEATALDLYGARQHAFRKARFDPLPAYTHIHNLGAEVALELGLVGLALLLVILGLVLRRAFQALSRAPQEAELENNLWGVVAAATVALSLSMFFALPWLPAAGLLMVVAFAGLIAVCHTVIGEDRELRTWEPDVRERQLAGRLVSVALLPLGLALAVGFHAVPLLLGDYHRQWANIYMLQKDPDLRMRAGEQLERSLEHHPDDVHALRLKGELALAAADSDTANASLDAALALRPDSLRLLVSKARATRASTWLDHALDLHPTYLDAIIARVTLDMSEGQDDVALRRLKKVLSMNLPPELAVELQIQMARVHLEARRFDDARSVADFAAKLARDQDLGVDVGALQRKITAAVEKKAREDAGIEGHGGEHH